ncbi:hypothetical protein NL676_039398 [Syzygium grande]|nr:hypothetical protein NL676_039398 [Syzygium grande]
MVFLASHAPDRESFDPPSSIPTISPRRDRSPLRHRSPRVAAQFVQKVFCLWFNSRPNAGFLFCFRAGEMAYVDHAFSISDEDMMMDSPYAVNSRPPIKEIALAVSLLVVGTLGIVLGTLMASYHVGGDRTHGVFFTVLGFRGQRSASVDPLR